VRYVDPDGQEKSESFPDKQLGAARAFLHKVENDKLAGTYLDPNAGQIVFKEHAASWLRGQSSDGASRQTLRSRIESQLNPFFGRRAVSSIGPALIREWLGSMTDNGLDTGYQALLFDTLSSIMNAAVDDKRIRSNPCRVRSVRRPKRAPRRVVPWTDARMRSIQLAIGERAHLAVVLAAGLGLRQGEVLGFSVDDVDRGAQVVHVLRQVRVVDRTLVFAPPKGGKVRDVPLSRGVLSAIDAHAEQYGSRSVTLPWLAPDGRPETAELVVVRADGRPWYGDLFNKVVWKAAFDQAGLDYRRRLDGMHALRHFYASRLLADGVSVKELAEYLGHSDAKVTLDTYTHLMPTSYERARHAIDSVFRPPAGGQDETA
jgi:integrase